MTTDYSEEEGKKAIGRLKKWGEAEQKRTRIRDFKGDAAKVKGFLKKRAGEADEVVEDVKGFVESQPEKMKEGLKRLKSKIGL